MSILRISARDTGAVCTHASHALSLESVPVHLNATRKAGWSSRPRTRRAHASRAAPGEAAHMHLIDDQLFHGQAQRAVALPVEGRAQRRQRGRRLRPGGRYPQHARVAVPQVLRRVRVVREG